MNTITGTNPESAPDAPPQWWQDSRVIGAMIAVNIVNGVTIVALVSLFFIF